jgi:hypothetical protein
VVVNTSDEERRVASALELFFDLIMAVSMGKLGETIAKGATAIPQLGRVLARLWRGTVPSATNREDAACQPLILGPTGQLWPWPRFVLLCPNPERAFHPP